MEVLLALTNAAYDLGCKFSLITELSRSFLRCKSMEELMSEGCRALKNPLIVTDHTQKILYCSDPNQISNPIYRNILASEYLTVGHPLLDAVNTAWNATDVPFQVDGTEVCFPVICKQLTVGTAIVGYFHILQFQHPFEAQDSSVAELLGNLMAVQLWQRRQLRSTAPQDKRERFLRDILDNLLGDQESALAHQRSLGLSFKGCLYALVFNLRRFSRSSTSTAIRTLPYTT